MKQVVLSLCIAFAHLSLMTKKHLLTQNEVRYGFWHESEFTKT